jgi:hypothetical protein
MIKSLSTVTILALIFAIASPLAAARVWVQVAPPAAVVETIPANPGAGYVWVGGYWTWNGAKYVWVPGGYVRHAGAWVAGHWRHVPGSGWYWVPGHWR